MVPVPTTYRSVQTPAKAGFGVHPQVPGSPRSASPASDGRGHEAGVPDFGPVPGWLRVLQPPTPDLGAFRDSIRLPPVDAAATVRRLAEGPGPCVCQKSGKFYTLVGLQGYGSELFI